MKDHPIKPKNGKRFPLILIHHAFTAATLVVLAAFLAFLAYAYAAFSGPLIGDIETAIPPELLSRLDEKRMASTLGGLKARMSLPDIPADLPDPYDEMSINRTAPEPTPPVTVPEPTPPTPTTSATETPAT